VWVLFRNGKAPSASLKSRRAEREGRARGWGRSTLPCLSSALSPPSFSVSSTSSPWHTDTLLCKPSFHETSQTTQPLPTAQAAHRDLPGCAMKQESGRRRRKEGGREGGCTSRAGNLSTPPSHPGKQKLSPTLQPLGAPCSRLAG